ncbi:hypothetical protein BJX99DRAFT_263436 [Aspergillus californicus]
MQTAPIDAMHTVDIIKDLCEIETFCRSNGYTLSKFFTVAWAVAIHRYFDQDTVYIAIRDDSIYDSSQEESERSETYRASMSVEMTIQFLFTDEAIIGPVPDNSVDHVYNQTGLWLVPEHVEQSSRGHTLDLVVRLGERVATLELYDRDLERLQNQGQHLLSTVVYVARNMLANPGGKIRNMALVDMAEVQAWRHQHQRERTEPGNQTFLEAFHQQRWENPNGLAICAWDGELTYAQLDVVTARFAADLRGRGVGVGSLVPMCFEKSIYAIICELAIFKAGGAFVALDPLHPENRLRQVLEQTQATIVVTSGALTERMSGLGLPVVTCALDLVSESAPAEDDTLSQTVFPDKDDTAYVVFSSGTTGPSSGCIMPHASMAGMARRSRDVHLTRASRVLQFASYSFAITVEQIFITLAAGATICIPSEHDRLNRLAEYIDEARITWALLTSSSLNAIPDPSLLSSLTNLLVSGEPMGRDHVENWAAHVSLHELYGFSEHCGFVAISPRIIQDSAHTVTAGLSSPTATLWLVDPVDHNRLMPVGAVAELVVEAPNLAKEYLNNPTKTADRFIHSAPWLPVLGPGRRVYKTGDLVQYLPDGSFRYIARKDLQVKIRGMRVDLAELEYSISQHCPSVSRVVAEAVVPDGADAAATIAVFMHYTSDEDDHGENLEKGQGEGAIFVAPRSWRLQFQLDANRLRQELPELLPQHMIPTIFLPLRYLPVTITGKVDRRRIRETINGISWLQLQTYAFQRRERIPPKTDAEVTLHELMTQVLGLSPDTFGVADSFLQHGGNSIKAMQLARLCRQAGVHSITFKDIMTRPTVQQLLSVYNDRNSDELSPWPIDSGVTLGLELDDTLNQAIAKRLRAFGLPETTTIQGVFPCSYVQEGILVNQARKPSLYQIRSTYRITPTASNNQNINVDQLRLAWKKLIKLHPMLRTIFIESTVPGLFALQVVLPDKACETPSMHDDKELSSLPQLTIKQDSGNLCSAVLSISHAITDALSMSIIIRDLKRLYGRGAHGPKSSSPTPLLYPNHITRVRQDMTPSVLDFWTSYLARVEPCLFPPMDTYRRVQNVPRWEHFGIQIEHASRYFQFSSITGITLASTFKLAWALLLSSYTASSRVCFGYSTSGRDVDVPGVEDVVGPFINVLPCPLDMEFANALPYQHVSLAAIQHSLGLVGENALFNTSVTITPELEAEYEESQIEMTEMDRWDPTENEILVEFTPVGGLKIGMELKYWTSTLSESQAQNVASTLIRILEQIIETPQMKVCEMQLMSTEDEARIHGWNRTLPPSNEVCVHALIEQQCAKYPEGEAVCSWDGSLTYGELDELASALSRELVKRGVHQGTYVPLCLSRSYWTPVAMLAVIKSGAAFTLLDTSHPLNRLRWVCDLLGTSIILTSTEHRVLAEQLGGKDVLCVDDRQDNISTPYPDQEIVPSPADALYVVFTSGSTGTPKGIVIEHRSYSSNAVENAKILGLSTGSRLLQISGYAFDVAIFEHLTVLLTGGCICIPSESDRLNHPEQFCTRIKVDTILTTPSLARLLNPEELPCVRVLGMAGEPLDQVDIDAWTPSVRVANIYGPAECTVMCTVRIDCNDVHPRNIGWPVACCAWITMPDDPSQLLPLGTVGELVIEGPIVARAYVKVPEQTALSFIEAPTWLRNFRGRSFSPERSRLYRTGDLVCYDPTELSLQYIGRKDTQVKLRGQRIELSEVEHQLRSHVPGAPTIVVDMVHHEQSTSLVAFILPDSDTKLEASPAPDTMSSIFARPSESFHGVAASARAQLQQHLPSYMVPAVFVPLLQMPLTRTGKIDRRKLTNELTELPSDLFQTLKGAALTPKTPPSSALERQLQRIWASTLRIPSDQIGVDDRFFSLGGDSASAIQAVALCRASGLGVSAADMMRSPTIAEILPRVETLQEGGRSKLNVAPFALLDNESSRVLLETVERLCGIEPVRVEDAYPCTSLQEGLIALTAKTNTAYVAEFRFRLPSGIDLVRLQSAWKATVAANSILRTRIVQVPGDSRCYQVVTKEEGPWGVFDDYEAYRRGIKDDLGLNKSLVQVAVAVESQPLLILRLHHAAYDGWSLPLLLDQIQRAYDGEGLNSHSIVPFLRYIQTQHDESSRWWKVHLEDVTTTVFPPLPSPTYQPIPDSTLVRKVHTGSMAHTDFSLATKLRLACAVVISQYTGRNDVVFGTTSSGRAAPVPDIHQLTGPTNATIPQYISLDPEWTVREALQHVQDRNARLVPYEQFGLRNIAQCGESHAAACGFQTLLVIQPSTREMGALFSDQIAAMDLSAFTGYLLLLDCQLFDDAVEIRAGFDATALSRTRVQQILRQFEHVLAQLNNPSVLDTHLTELEQIHEEDSVQLLSWNSSKEDPNPEQSILDVFQGHFEKQPGALAVCAWDGDFIYAELDQLSGRLSELLQSCGVCPETIVPIYSEKSRWVTVAILGVIRAGGAFVLLDPTYPIERLQQIFQQTRARTIVASKKYTQLSQDLVQGGTVVTVGHETSSTWRHEQKEDTIHQTVWKLGNPKDLLYVVFTSGSTGQPKGAMIEHRSWHISAIGLHGQLNMGPHTRTLQFSSHAFDISVWDHLGTLLAGGCICIPSEAQRKNNLANVMTEMQVNLAILTPSVARTLGGPIMAPKLQTLVLAGELMSREDISTWRLGERKVHLINGYGPAECAGITTIKPVLGLETDDPGNVGRPNRGFSVWVTHPDNPQRVLPVGAIGEIVVEGPAVGRGYLHDPERSAASFISSPRWLRRLRGAEALDACLYRTGDIGRYQEDGMILFLGRRDKQVKIRGQRVELNEVEYHVSKAFAGASDVFALVIDQGKRQILVALVSGCSEDSKRPGIFGDSNSQRFLERLPAVQTVLDHTLPAYMVPTVFIPLVRVPLTQSGKTDRRLLHRLVSKLSQRELEAFAGSQKSHRPPASKAEEALQSIFARTLGLDAQCVSADAHFFKIGGDSISAMRMVAEARRDGVSLTVADIFISPILSALATVNHNHGAGFPSSYIDSYSPGTLLDIDSVKAFAATLPNLPLPFAPGDIADILPATRFQTSCLDGDHVLYHWLRLPESLDIGRLEAACRALVRHHPILRTLFIPYGPRYKYLQVIPHDLNLSIIPITCDESIHDLTEALCTRDKVWARTLGSPLFRIYLVSQTGSGHRRLIIRLSHAQYDGTSFGHVLRDLSIAYDNNQLQSSAPSFAQYLFYKQSLPSSAPDTPPFWVDYLRGSHMTDFLPSIHSTQIEGAHTIVAEREIPLPPDHDGIPIAFLAQATWAVILSQLTGSQDLLFGFVSQSRNAPLPYMDEVQGPCSNIVPIRVALDPSWTIGQLIHHVQDQYIRMLPHATLDLKEIQPFIPEWPPSIRFGSVFNHINMTLLAPPRLGGVECEQGAMSPGGAAGFLRGYSRFLVRTTRRGDKFGVYMSGWEGGITQGLVDDAIGRFVDAILAFSGDYNRGLDM